MMRSQAMRCAALALLISGLSAIAKPATGETPDERKGREIAEEIDRRDIGFGDTRASIEMILRDPSGRSNTRKLRVLTLEVASDEDGDKSLVQFVFPPDIEGTALLSFPHFESDDDQWLYLPALKRVKRIASSNKSGPFVGSEFAYEDMMEQNNKKYMHRWLRDEDCGTLKCFVIERRPKDTRSGYQRQVVWVDKEHYRPIRVDFYDRKNAILKKMRYEDYRIYLGRYWRAHELVMENQQSRKSTILKVGGYEFKVGLRESDFDPNRLQHMR